MNNGTVSLTFLLQQKPLSWSDLCWAYERQLVDWKTLVLYARERKKYISSNDMEGELAYVDKEHVWKVGEFIRALASAENCPKDLPQRKWLYLRLLWTYENRSLFSDPLEEVENIYADFFYPKEIAGFVRYMPATDGYSPKEFTIAENEARLFDKWGQYLKIWRGVVG